MKTSHFPNARRCLIFAFLVGLTIRLAAQTDLPPMPPGFWEWWREYQRARAGAISPADDDGPPSPGGFTGVGDGGTPPSPFTNDVVIGTNLWLLIEATTNQTVVVTLSNTVAGSNYLLLAATSLSGPWFTNQSLLAPDGTNDGGRAHRNLRSQQPLFYRPAGPARARLVAMGHAVGQSYKWWW